MKHTNVVLTLWMAVASGMALVITIAVLGIAMVEAEAEQDTVQKEPIQQVVIPLQGSVVARVETATVSVPTIVPTATPTPTPTATPTPTPACTVTDDERDILYRIVEAEVTGEGSEATYEAKKNVVSCILVRTAKGWADGTIKGVVFEHNQFSPISDGRYYTVEVTKQTIDAVDWVLEHGATHQCEYFCTPTCKSYTSGFHAQLTEAFEDSEHVYFYGD